MLGTRPRPGSGARANGTVSRAPAVRAPAPRPPLGSRFDQALVIGLVLGAFAARVWQLGTKSLWLDEGISVRFATGDVPTVLRTLTEHDLHPPLYYLVLNAWMTVAGRGETAVRFPSVVFGLLLVPLLYRFARSLYPGWVGRASGLLAAALAAVSPYLIYYAQEARMYGALATAGLAATLALGPALSRGGWRWLVYVLCLAVPPYLHYFGWMVVAFHAAYVALLLPRLRRRALPWLGAVGLVLVAYLPWAIPAARQIARLRNTPDFWLGALSLSFVVQHAFAGFAVGFAGALEHSQFVLAAFVGAALLGLVVLLARGLIWRRGSDLLLVVYLVVPLLMLYAVVAQNPKFADRYLIVVLPPFLLLLARGSVGLAEAGLALRRRVPAAGWALAASGAALGLAILVFSGQEGRRVYGDDHYAKDDNRAAVDYLINNWHEGDAVVLLPDFRQVFDYYAHGLLARYPIQPEDDVVAAAAALNDVVAHGHTRLWVLMWNVDWADPTGATRALLDEQAERVPLDREGFRGLPLRLYTVKEGFAFDPAPRPSRTIDARFGDALQLLGYDLDSTTPVAAGDQRRVALYWAAQRKLDQDLRFALRLVRGGHEWWRLDTRPAAYTYPTLYWKRDWPVRGSFQIAVPPGTPPGSYDLQLVVYDAATQRELPLGGQSGSVFQLGSIEVARPTAPPEPAALRLPAVAPNDLDGLQLVGAKVSAERAAAGQSVELTLGWRLTGPPKELAIDYWLFDANGAVQRLGNGAPVDGTYPVSRWTNGEVVVDKVSLTIPRDVVPGRARLVVSAREPSAIAKTANRVEVGQLDLEARAHEMNAPQPSKSLDVRLGEVAALVGADVPLSTSRGGQFPVTLYWRANAAPPTSYSVFVHVVDAAEKPLAQRDGVPLNGLAPTTGWMPGEYIRDTYDVPIGAGLAPGRYRVVVGMYDPSSGERLPVVDGGAREAGRRAVIGTVEVR